MPVKKRLEIISLGDELLLGLRDNSHLTYLGRELSRKGLAIQRDQEIRDSAEDIKRYFLDAWEKTDILITTGGLGPTVDDITRETIAEALNVPLVFKKEVEDKIRQRLADIGKTMSPNNSRQAYLLEGAEILENPNGTAPGQWFERDDKILIMLPGPGSELRPMFIDHVMPRLEARDIAIANDAYLQLRACGIGESSLETKLQPLFEPFGDKLKVAYCANDGLIDVRLGSNGDALKWNEIEALGEQCREILGFDFVGFGEATPAEVILKHLRAINKTFAVAESCTGGLVSSAFTDIPGASKVFLGGVVCYNNDVKVSLLGVPESIIQQHGAVSAECAVAMATAVQERFESDYAVSITGYAGPAGGTEKSPVGTVYIGFASPSGVWSHKTRITGSRMSVRARGATTVVDWMRRKLKKYETQDVLESLAS